MLPALVLATFPAASRAAPLLFSVCAISLILLVFSATVPELELTSTSTQSNVHEHEILDLASSKEC